VHRIDAGQEPLCVAGCPSKAMIFGDLDDPNSLIHKKLSKSVPLLSSEGTQPKVRYFFSDNLLKAIETRIRKNPKMMRC
jgi:Fe-S-cluster-containing dehydrogenase component